MTVDAKAQSRPPDEANCESLKKDMATHRHDPVFDLERSSAASEPLTFADSILKTPTDLRVTLVRKGKRYHLDYDGWYRNDLMLLVGYLEFFNALDFPANVWNDIPIPTFAKALMIICGTLIILASTIAAIDLRRSVRNIRRLREERKYLLQRLEQDQKCNLPTSHWRAWLALNFREMGWEIFDRLLLDSLVGCSSILVGPGTIMAIAGSNPRIFLASNLMSGYIGNSFAALYGLINSFWAVYLFLRATRHKSLVLEYVKEDSLRKRATTIFTRHQIYAALNGLTLVVSGVGSLISATMWWGYIILIPCIFCSIYCNTLWRKSIGYDRRLFPRDQHDAATILERIQASVTFQQQASGNVFAKMSQRSLISLIEDHNMMGAIAVDIVKDKSAREVIVRDTPDFLSIDSSILAMFEQRLLARKLQICTNKARHQGTLDEERFLFELLGSVLSVGNKQNSKAQ